MRHQWTVLIFQWFFASHPILLELQSHMLDQLILFQSSSRLCSLESLKCWPNSSKLGRMLSPNCLPCSRWKLKSLLFQRLIFNRLLRVSLHICSSGWAKVLRGVYTQIWWLPILWFLFFPTWLFPSQFLASLAASDSNTSSQLRLCFSSSYSTP